MLSIEQELDRGDSYIQEGNRKISKEQAKKIADRFNTEIMQRAAILGDFTKKPGVLMARYSERIKAARFSR